MTSPDLASFETRRFYTGVSFAVPVRQLCKPTSKVSKYVAAVASHLPPRANSRGGRRVAQQEMLRPWASLAEAQMHESLAKLPQATARLICASDQRPLSS
jgi:hypothetical protein